MMVAKRPGVSEIFGLGNQSSLANNGIYWLFLFPQPELTSTPNFVVEVIKNDGKKALVLDCHYPEDEVCGMECWHLGIPGDKQGLQRPYWSLF